MSGNIRQISFNTRELLNGETWEKYDDAHRVLAAILTGLRNAGFRRNEALHFLRDHEGEGVRRLRRHYKGKFDSQVMSKWAAIERKDSRHQRIAVTRPRAPSMLGQDEPDVPSPQVTP